MTAAEFSSFEHSVVGITYMVIGISGTLLSLLVALTFIREKGLFKYGRAWLHISLAIANVGVVGAFPFSGSSSFSGRWLYGSGLCTFYGFIGMFFGIAAIGNVFALCVERYLVSKKKDSVDKVSNQFYWMITALVWINAFFWGIMPALGWTSYDIEPSGTSCTIKWQNYDSGYPSFMAMLSLTCFLIPLPVALICLVLSGTDKTTEDKEEKTYFREDQLRSTCTFLLMLALLGWGPYCFICIWALFADTTQVSMLAAVIPPLAAKTMVLLYPVAYCQGNKRFKNAFLGMFSFNESPKQQ
nr:peropsin [Lottia peitaihoensis]